MCLLKKLEGEICRGCKQAGFENGEWEKWKKSRTGKRWLALSLRDAVQVHARDSSGKLQIFRHDRYALGMERVEVWYFENRNEHAFRGFLKLNK